ncbi:helix-turn-helix domain-containing protein [Mucilaginibacter sp. JRF]|uniref:AraC family transcriptional regulator n=1 Tax=Mucilaginibacter sp. JRF TaxID=2780088 RepID=UPI00187FE57D|nr:AraC family transcriptional regulator [Mucilaginibacter sp. JRF]MBE9583148.1 helix-turn-helix domain-containing protein [Mucilaginibacter sp. JRF]
MKSIINKSPIPQNRSFVIQHLQSHYFDPHIHAHPEYQLFYVVEGRGTRFIGDNIKSFNEGDIVFLGPNVPHLWRSDKEYFDARTSLQTSGIVLYMSEHFLTDTIGNEEFEKLKNLFDKSLMGVEVTGQTNAEVKNMLIQLLSMSGLDSIIQLLKILKLIAESNDCTLLSQTPFSTMPNDKANTRMNNIYEFVMRNFQANITLESAADLVNMAPTSFSRFFKSRVNKSFSEFVKDVRIDHACKLLLDENIPISHIAFKIGYPTLSNFNKQFKALKGETPFDYRKKYREINNGLVSIA